jgi:NAD(P)H-quinone oxidoreductase subunit L
MNFMPIPETILVALIYAVLGGLYLLVIPGLVYFYLKNRWYQVSSFERSFMYFLVFFFFPGLLLLSPFLNFRPQRRDLEASR